MRRSASSAQTPVGAGAVRTEPFRILRASRRLRPSVPRLAALALLAAALTGCWPADHGGDFHGVPQDPPDLRVQQSPNDTIRIGETVTFTAVFRDSLNPKWRYNWRINTNSAAATGSKSRMVRWVAPSVPGVYESRLFVSDVSASSRAEIYVRTTVLP